MTPQTTPRLAAEEYGDQILTKAVKAGRRTYFFDVRGTRGGDYFLTITESRKVTNPDGSFSYDRHKIFLYKEDFEKFSDGLSEVVAFIRRSKPEFFERREREKGGVYPFRPVYWCRGCPGSKITPPPSVGVWLWRGCFRCRKPVARSLRAERLLAECVRFPQFSYICG